METLHRDTSMLCNDVSSEMQKYNTQVFSLSFLKRKLILNLLTFQRVFQEVLKLAALLIVLCKRRSNTILNEGMKHDDSECTPKESPSAIDIKVRMFLPAPITQLDQQLLSPSYQNNNMNKSHMIATKVEPSFSEIQIDMMKSSDAMTH